MQLLLSLCVQLAYYTGVVCTCYKFSQCPPTVGNALPCNKDATTVPHLFCKCFAALSGHDVALYLVHITAKFQFSTEGNERNYVHTTQCIPTVTTRLSLDLSFILFLFNNKRPQLCRLRECSEKSITSCNAQCLHAIFVIFCN